MLVAHPDQLLEAHTSVNILRGIVTVLGSLISTFKNKSTSEMVVELA